MFEQLFGSRIIEKVLFYMIANNKCFASELRNTKTHKKPCIKRCQNAENRRSQELC
jgi:hypothetical protein